MDGRFHGWAGPPGRGRTIGRLSFPFDARRRLSSRNRSPSEVDVQVAAFAHDVQVFANPKAFEASRTGDGWHTSQAFIPSGLIGARDGARAEAAFTGHIVRSERKTNKLTGAEFVWCLVTSTGGTFDVVADLELLPKLPPVGGVITGDFWLTGRVGGCVQSTQIIASEGWKRSGSRTTLTSLSADATVEVDLGERVVRGRFSRPCIEPKWTRLAPNSAFTSSIAYDNSAAFRSSSNSERVELRAGRKSESTIPT